MMMTLMKIKSQRIKLKELKKQKFKPLVIDVID